MTRKHVGNHGVPGEVGWLAVIQRRSMLTRGTRNDHLYALSDERKAPRQDMAREDLRTRHSRTVLARRTTAEFEALLTVALQRAAASAESSMIMRRQ